MPPRALIVDENPSVRDLLVISANLFDLAVGSIAEHGTQAVHLAISERPDVIILGDEMQLMSGLAALPLLRAAAPRATIVVYGTSDEAATVEAAIAAGADAYFQRGIDSVTELFAYVAERLRDRVRAV